MTFDYAATAATALGLLKEYGQSITRRSLNTAAYSVSTGAATQTYTDSPRTGALFDFGAGKTTERANQINVGDKRLLLDASNGVALTDLFVVGGVTYSVVSIGEISPAGTPVLYDLHLRS